jgi:hypothetical protein
VRVGQDTDQKGLSPWIIHFRGRKRDIDYSSRFA